MEYDGFSLGNIIQEIRRDKKLNQAEMAEKVDISVTHYARIEEGKNTMSINVFLRILDVLDIDANTVLGFKDVSYDYQAMEFLKKYLKLDTKEKEKIIRVVNIMVDSEGNA